MHKIDTLLSDEIDIALRLRAKKILKELAPREGEKVLDAGCGWGYYLRFLNRLWGEKVEITGLDIEPTSIIRAKTEMRGTKTQVVGGDVTKMPFKANSFDKVILSEVLEHLLDERRALKEIYRVLKPNGYLLISVPNANYPLFWDPVNWFLQHFFKTHIKEGFWAGIWTNHLRLYTRARISRLLNESGFKIGEVESLTRWCLPFNKNLLYGGKLPSKVSRAFMKKLKSPQKTAFIRVILTVVDFFDRINSLSISKDTGVSIFVKALK